MTSTEVTPYEASPLSERMEYAKVLASAGDLIPRALFGPPIDGKPPQPSPGKVLLVLETGAMLNLHPIAALQGINVIEGKAAASAALISAVARNAGHTLRVTSTGTVEGGDYAATATLIRHDDAAHPFESTWTPQRAARAGLCSYSPGADGVWRVKARSAKDLPLPWESYTESLCKARAVTEAARDGAQDALYGVRYTPEELGANVDERGDVIEGDAIVVHEDATPEPSALPPARKRATRGTQGTKRPSTPAADPEPAEEPTAPVEDVVEADVVEDVPNNLVGGDPTAMDNAADIKAARADDAEPGESEVDYQQRKLAERKPRVTSAAAEPFVDTATGETYGTVEELDAAIRARLTAKLVEEALPAQPEPFPEDAAPGDVQPHPFDVAYTEEPENYLRQLAASDDVAQVRDVWNRATAAGHMDSALRVETIRRKAEVS